LYLAAKSSPAVDAPRFLGPGDGGANQRGVTRPGEMTREEYAARHANDTLTIRSGDFERFKAGEVVFDCTVRCSFAYGSRKGGWRALHEKRAWRDLAVSVMQAGYLSDLAYFMLGEAARGLGFQQAAATYYKRALDAGRQHGCAGECEGFKVEALARAALGG
jgi:hypothetical protein